MHVQYDCKLVHRLETEFDPYTRCDADDVMLKLAAFVVDPRFQGASLFLKLYGDAVGPLADTVKTAYKYILKAREVKPRKVSYGRIFRKSLDAFPKCSCEVREGLRGARSRASSVKGEMAVTSGTTGSKGRSSAQRH